MLSMFIVLLLAGGGLALSAPTPFGDPARILRHRRNRPAASFLLRLSEDHPGPAAAIATGGGGAVDLNGLHARFGLRADQVDMQQPVVEPRTFHLDPFREHERPLKLPCRDPSVQEDATLAIVSLPPPYYQLVVFLRYLQVIHGKS